MLTVSNSNGCSDTAMVAVTNTSGPVASFTANPSSGAAPLTVNFNNNSTGATIFSWVFGDGNSSALQNPDNTYTATGTYTVILVVANAAGCTDTTTENITVYDGYQINLPNVFTPNGDFTNEIFRVKTVGVVSLEGNIYDRWGIKVFTWNGINDGWDGRLTSGQAAPDGTYFYIINAIGQDGQEHEEKGSLLLIH